MVNIEKVLHSIYVQFDKTKFKLKRPINSFAYSLSFTSAFFRHFPLTLLGAVFFEKKGIV